MSNNDKAANMITFTNKDSEGEVTDRIVKVFGFEVTEQGAWYANGFCHSAWARRTFRMDRIIGTITEMETGEILSVPDWLERFIGVHPDDADLETLEKQSRYVKKRTVHESNETWRQNFSRPVQPGKGVLFTGFKAAERAELEAMVPQVGWHVRKSVSPTVDIVVAGYNAGPKKVQEAIDLGISIVSEKVFREMYLLAKNIET